ncbi:Peroxidase 19 [Nymphaea thermarum]|nr:Peroxidase 19 [Nymphaea thermarum]
MSFGFFVRVSHQLSVDFYSTSCPQLEQLVFSVTSQRFKEAPVSAPSTIRLFFHDCFVEGCDASILITGPGSEREALDNEYLAAEAFESVGTAKAVVESKCPGVVSCADILAIAARDFVFLNNLPRSNSTVDDLLKLFASKGLNKTDLVALSGAHTIGFAHCRQFAARLYNYNHTNRSDPLIEPRLLKALQMLCPRTGGNANVVAPCDVVTPFNFDNVYYKNLEANMSLLASDQALFLDPRTRGLVRMLGKHMGTFFDAFSQAMDKMGSIGIKLGNEGEIRRDCSRHN